MTHIDINLDRLHLNVQGVSSPVIEEAIQLLRNELIRRLTERDLGIIGNVNVGDLALPTIHGGAPLNASALSGLIAERMIAAIVDQSV